MKNSLTPNYQTPTASTWLKLCLHLLAALLLVLAPILLARAQKPAGAVTVSSVSARPGPNVTLVTIAADGSLNAAQTFQDRDGFHVFVPDADVSDLVTSSKGVRVRKIGSAVEILLQINQETPVEVKTVDNHISLTIDGKLDLRPTESDAGATERSNTHSLPTDYSSSSRPTYSWEVSPPSTSSSPDQSTPATAVQSPMHDAGESRTKDEGGVTDAAPVEEGALASVFSGMNVLVVFALAVVGLLVVRKVRSKNGATTEGVESRAVNDEGGADRVEHSDKSTKKAESSTGFVRSRPAPSSRQQKSVVGQTVAIPGSLYGPYRIDQEVGRLVLGQAHRTDVLSSRASEDRRAIQASLIKTIVSPESSEDQRRLAREALEAYGFVARECAALLLAAGAFERTSAARSLGEIASSLALPFLLEALYDAESIVRNQAVVSIGKLKEPSAIGALLDMACKQPDVPCSLVSGALSACSIEGFGVFDTLATTSLRAGINEPNGFDFTRLEPRLSVEALPESLDDEGLTEALVKAVSEDVEERVEAIKLLAQYPAKNSVATLVSIAQQDQESSVRALAMSSLAFIDHESVFPAVLIGMADESREIRAAAARALSRLSFDRSEAYINLLQTADDDTLHKVAKACIKAGIVSQHVDRLSSGDRRQAYESFALICILAKARMTDLVLEAIVNHANLTIRLNTVRLLASTGQSYLFDQLQELSARSDIHAEVKTALLDGMCQLERSSRGVRPIDGFATGESEDEFGTSETGPQAGCDFDVHAQDDRVDSNLQTTEV